MRLDILLCDLVAAPLVQSERVVFLHEQPAALLLAQYLLAARVGQTVLPVFPPVYAAALQPGLDLVPRVRNGPAVAVEPQRAQHAVLEGLVHFLAEHVAQNSADEHCYEYQEHGYEVLKKVFVFGLFFFNYKVSPNFFCLSANFIKFLKSFKKSIWQVF